MRVPLERVYGHIKLLLRKLPEWHCSLTINNKTICVGIHDVGVYQKNSCFKIFQLKSLIMAQIERWRQA
jgi:hypothetical protein